MMPLRTPYRKEGAKPQLKTIKRLITYITKKYKAQFLFVLVCILLSTAASVAGALFLRILVDDYIIPLTAMDNPVFGGFLRDACHKPAPDGCCHPGRDRDVLYNRENHREQQEIFCPAAEITGQD
jgi:ABC-type multidrug transport system fused ATPase/permease subunit